MSDISITSTDKKLHSSADISKHFVISESTLRKYSQLLEKYGWTFTKTERNARLFTDTDRELLKMFVSLRNETNMSLEVCSDISVTYFQRNKSLTRQESANIDNALSAKQQSNVVQELRHANKKMTEEIQRLNEKIDNMSEGQNIVIDKFNKVLDDNESIKEHMNELIKAKSSEQKKSLISRIFNR